MGESTIGQARTASQIVRASASAHCRQPALSRSGAHPALLCPVAAFAPGPHTSASACVPPLQLFDVWQSHLNLSTYYWPQFEPVSESNRVRALDACPSGPQRLVQWVARAGSGECWRCISSESKSCVFCLFPPAQVYNNPDVIRGRDNHGACGASRPALTCLNPDRLCRPYLSSDPLANRTPAFRPQARTTGCSTSRSHPSTR